MSNHWTDALGNNVSATEVIEQSGAGESDDALGKWIEEVAIELGNDPLTWAEVRMYVRQLRREAASEQEAAE